MATYRKAAVEVEGLKELQKLVRKLPDDVRDEMKGIHKDAASTVLPTAQARVPRQSGALASTLRISATRRTGALLAGSSSVPYAGVIHYGWPNRRVVFGKRTAEPSPIRAQPFLKEALRLREPQVVLVFETNVRKLIAKSMARYGVR